MPGNMEFYKSISKQVGKGETGNLICMDLEIKILEKLLFKGYIRNLFAISVEKN